MKQVLKDTKKEWVKRNAPLLVEAAKDAASKTLEEVCKEGAKIFDQCINQFYLYETQSYYRHVTGRGTKTGWNLYLANGFKAIYQDDRVVSFTSGWDSTDMLPYRSWKDKDKESHPVSTEYVLNNVMSGIRGLEDKYVNHGYAPRKPYDNHWTAEINSYLFGELSGTPKEIFKKFDDTWKDVATTLNKKYRYEAFDKLEIRW